MDLPILVTSVVPFAANQEPVNWLEVNSIVVAQQDRL